MLLELNTAEKLRNNWQYLSAEQIQQLIDEQIVDVTIEAATNQSAMARNYQGTADIRAMYRAFGEFIRPASEYIRVQINPATAYAVAGLIVQMEPAVLAALIQANGGTMPLILPPILPPAPEPVEPTPEEPQPETPTTSETSAD